MIGSKPKPLRAQLRRFGQRVGLDIRPYAPQSSAAARRSTIMARHQIELVLDVGANLGQYARELRSGGYTGRIVSFEPLAKPFETLEHESKRDPTWQCLQLALGATASEATMNVAANKAASSSLLPMRSWIAGAAPEQAYVGTEVVQVAPLDDAAPPLIAEHRGVMLKLDVQGYELEVLRGGVATIAQVDLVEIELSLVSLYKDQPLWREAMDYLADVDFELLCLNPALHDDRGCLLQMDGIFARSKRRSSLGM